jgi:hypothetical protein
MTLNEAHSATLQARGYGFESLCAHPRKEAFDYGICSLVLTRDSIPCIIRASSRTALRRLAPTCSVKRSI